LAFATQIQAERKGINNEELEHFVQKAMDLYGEAIKSDFTFLPAHNNLGYLYLERAKRTLNKADENGTEKTQAMKRAEADLERAREHCEKAVELDPTYPHAFDNLGNIWREKS